MHAALRRENIIDEPVDRLIVGIIVLHGHFDHDIVLYALEIHDIRVQCLRTAVQILHKFPDASLVMEGALLFFSRTRVAQHNAKTLRQKGSLTQTGLQCVEIIFRILEDFRVRLEIYARTAFFRITAADDFERIHGFTSLIALLINFSIMKNLHFKP